MDGLFIKLFHGAYKYAITQTFAIPTVDDAEKGKTNEGGEDIDLDNEETLSNGALNENMVEEMLGTPSVDNFNSIFDLDGMSA